MRSALALDPILTRALAGQAPTRDECRYLLGLGEHSGEARMLMAVADRVTRSRFDNDAVLFGQVGFETAPCSGECDFCTFSRTLGSVPHERLSVDEVVARAKAFTATGDVFALFLMSMHVWDFDAFAEAARAVRDVVPAHTRLVANVGDFGLERAKKLRELGVSGVYHVLRLREGTDTRLEPATRLRSIDAAREVGLDFYYCLEPVGPEHTPDEMVEQLFIGVERGSFQHAAMRRVRLPGSRLEAHGQITNLRLAQVTAVVALATLGTKETTNIAVHEPNLLGLAAGANAIYAETGANPRDARNDTGSARGLDVAAARRMLHEAGFTKLRRGDGTHVALTG